jgi:hypothetical protein
MRTYQLRRYEIDPGTMPQFVEWMDSLLIPARESFGYRVEFKLIDNENSQFVWCVSLPGDHIAFLEIQDQYNSSEARAKAFESSPNCFKALSVSFVEALDLPK